MTTKEGMTTKGSGVETQIPFGNDNKKGMTTKGGMTKSAGWYRDAPSALGAWLWHVSMVG